MTQMFSYSSMQKIDNHSIPSTDNGCLSPAKSTITSKPTMKTHYLDGRIPHGTHRQRHSFNAIISLSTRLERDPISTTEHKVCSLIGFIICVLLLWMLIYGELTFWEHSSYIMNKSDNTTKIYNTSFIVRCSWRSRHVTNIAPIDTTSHRTFGHLCTHKVNVEHSEHSEHSCVMSYTGKIWFGSLLCTFITVFLSSMILVFPKPAMCKKEAKYAQCIGRIWSLQYVKYLLVLSGVLCFASVLPVSILSEEMDICGDAQYSEWDVNTYNGAIVNVEVARWTLYLPPIIGILLCFLPCFFSQIPTQSGVLYVV
eukprot:36447_1